VFDGEPIGIPFFMARQVGRVSRHFVQPGAGLVGVYVTKAYVAVFMQDDEEFSE
jgi:hypothetical protein